MLYGGISVHGQISLWLLVSIVLLTYRFVSVCINRCLLICE